MMMVKMEMLLLGDGIYTTNYQFPVNGDEVKFYIKRIIMMA